MKNTFLKNVADQYSTQAFARQLPHFKFELCTWFTNVDRSSVSPVKPNHNYVCNACSYLHTRNVRYFVLSHIYTV